MSDGDKPTRLIATDPDGVNQRVQIDTETVKALLLINGGGIIALLTFLPSIIGKVGYEGLVYSTFIGVMLLIIGLACAVIHNRLRRKCSLLYNQHKWTPPFGDIFGFKLNEPTVCFMSICFMWASIISFFAAGTLVAISGIIALENLPS